MVDKNYFHLFHRPFSLVKLALHAFLFFGGGVCTIVYRAPSEYLQVFVTSCLRFCIYSDPSVYFVFVDVVVCRCGVCWCFLFSSVCLCYRGCPVLLFIQHSYRTIITITHRHYVTNFFIMGKKYINNFPLLPTKRRIILHQTPLLSSYWLSHKDVPYLVFVQKPVHTPHLIHLWLK